MLPVDFKIKKAPGPNGTPVEVLKGIADKPSDILLKMCNSCLMEEVFPKAWKEQMPAKVMQIRYLHTDICALNHDWKKLFERTVAYHLGSMVLATLEVKYGHIH